MTGQEVSGTHLGELALRRLRAGESFTRGTSDGASGRASGETAAWPAAGDATAHAAGCPDCRARWKALDDEQRRFEQEISFDRFAAGVERAMRSAPPARARAPGLGRALRFAVPALAVAAGVALFVGTPGGRGGHNTLKGGGAGITVRVAAGEGPQRTAAEGAPEALALGERVRIGYQAGAHRYLLSLSIDERGTVTPLYPESGRSVPVGKAVGAGPRYLPDSVEFTDAGTERLFVILSDEPVDVEAARRAARASFDRAKGDILHMPALDLPGEQFQRTFIKP
jgi:hypothetical protein